MGSPMRQALGSRPHALDSCFSVSFWSLACFFPGFYPAHNAMGWPPPCSCSFWHQAHSVSSRHSRISYLAQITNWLSPQNPNVPVPSWPWILHHSGPCGVSELKKMKLVGKLRPREQKDFIDLPELSSSSDSESSGSLVCWNINVSSYGIGDGP